MSNPYPQEVIDSIGKGIRKAQMEYQKAAGIPLCHGPEYLITVGIFQSILKLTKGGSLTLEVNLQEMLKYLKRSRRPTRKSHSAPSKERGDIFFWYVGTNKLRAIIEVKKYAQDCHKDLKRVIRLLGKGLEFAVLASCMQKKIKNDNENEVKERIRNNRQRLYQKIKKQVNSNSSLEVELVKYKITTLTFEDEKPGDKENWVWCPVIFKIYFKKNHQ